MPSAEPLNKMGNGRTFALKANRDRNRPFTKLKRPELECALAAYDSVAAASTEIRARHDLAPVPDTESIAAGRSRLRGMAKAKRRKARAKKAAPSLAAIPTTPDAIRAELDAVRQREAALLAMLGEHVDTAPAKVPTLPIRRVGTPSPNGHPDVAPSGLAGLIR